MDGFLIDFISNLANLALTRKSRRAEPQLGDVTLRVSKASL
jgi:hypothetical protein